MINLPDDLRSALADALLGSPVLSVMVVDGGMNIVWHNEAFARDMGAPGEDLTGQKCYAVARDAKQHAGCPTRSSLTEGRHTRGLYDFGEKYAAVLTIPLPGGLAVKVHSFLAKEAGKDGEP